MWIFFWSCRHFEMAQRNFCFDCSIDSNSISMGYSYVLVHHCDDCSLFHFFYPVSSSRTIKNKKYSCSDKLIIRSCCHSCVAGRPVGNYYLSSRLGVGSLQGWPNSASWLCEDDLVSNEVLELCSLN